MGAGGQKDIRRFGRGLAVVRLRDLLVLPETADKLVVIGCDSSGAIGAKPLDAVKAPAYVVGRFALRVALMEVMAAGATPVAVAAALCSEPDPTGVEINRGIADELADAGLAGKVALTGSSEKNIPTEQTGLGITVIGLADRAEVRAGRSRGGDEVLCVGLPKVGHEVRLEDPEIVSVADLKCLLTCPRVHEIVPAGSRGIAHEAAELAASSRLRFESKEQPGVDIRKSAGPATCLVAAAEPGAMEELRGSLKKPVFHVGWLR